MLHEFLSDERGSTAIEYALLASLVGLVIMVGLQGLGSGLDANFSSTATAVGTP